MGTRRQALLKLWLICSTSPVEAAGIRRGRLMRIGILSEGEDSHAMREWEAYFWPEMRKLNWIPGTTVVVDRAFADWKAERLGELAKQLVQKGVDVILCNGGDDAMVSAARATRTIPIVFFDAFAPAEQGLIDSFSRPGHNLTGLTMYAGADFATKRLEFLRALAPSATRLSWLWGGNSLSIPKVDGGLFDVAKMISEAARGLGFETRLHLVKGPQDMAATLEDVAAWGAHAITAGGWQVLAAGQNVVDFALLHRLPSIYPVPEYLELGGLAYYGVPFTEIKALVVRWAWYVDQVLNGARPVDLPVEGPKRYELTINMKTALAMGLKIPQSVLLRADAVLK